MSEHIAVMTQEVIEALRPRDGGLHIDATLGGATHTKAMLKACGPTGRVMSLDVDPAALRRAKESLSGYGEHWVGVEANFRDLERIATECGFAPCDGVLFDLGLSSDELADLSKGLSFKVEGPLDMRLGPKANEDGLMAADIVNSWRRQELESVIREYGEERYAAKIVEAIVAARKSERILSTLRLADIIAAAVPQGYERGRIHPATRTFQALRMTVNDEVASLKAGLAGARAVLKPGGRVAVISFHSLEDRVVKLAFREADDLVSVTKKPIIPKAEEVSANPRARSAKLRIAEKSPTLSQNIKYVANSDPDHDAPA